MIQTILFALLPAISSIVTILFSRYLFSFPRFFLRATAVVLLAVSATSLWSGLAPQSFSSAVQNLSLLLPKLMNAMGTFYSSTSGSLAGTTATTIATYGGITALPIFAAVILFRRRKKQPKYRKRCSSCHYIFPPNMKAGQNCPNCGAFWNYEKE